MTELREEAARVMQQADCLYDRGSVEDAFNRMAAAINRDMSGSDAMCICVMNGGLVATGILLPRLTVQLRVDYMHASRYRERTSGDELHWKVEPAQLLAGKDLLIVDDILDLEGTTKALGKTSGKDSRACKVTYPAVHGIEGARRAAVAAVDAARDAVRPLAQGSLLASFADLILNRRS